METYLEKLIKKYKNTPSYSAEMENLDILDRECRKSERLERENAELRQEIERMKGKDHENQIAKD